MIKVNERIVSACASGKLILSGEHAVHHGCPALATAIDMFTTVTISATQDHNAQFKLVDLNQHWVTDLAELNRLKNNIDERYAKFAANALRLDGVLEHPRELVGYAFIHLINSWDLNLEQGVEIVVNSSLPVGCGMGSSAALIISLIHAAVNYFAIPLSSTEYLSVGRAIEKLQHGRSSGLDLYVALHGGYHFFFNGASHRRPMFNLPFVGINTGGPRYTNSECLAKAAEFLRNKNILAEFTKVTHDMDDAIKIGDVAGFKETLRKNHRLLCDLGVVPPRVMEFIRAIEELGGGAKISGTGSVSGNGGVVLAVADDLDIIALVKEYGYKILPLKTYEQGATCVYS